MIWCYKRTCMAKAEVHVIGSHMKNRYWPVGERLRNTGVRLNGLNGPSRHGSRARNTFTTPIPCWISPPSFDFDACVTNTKAPLNTQTHTHPLGFECTETDLVLVCTQLNRAVLVCGHHHHRIHLHRWYRRVLLLWPPGLHVLNPPSRSGHVCVSERCIKRIGMAETTPLLFSMRSNVYGTAWTPGHFFFASSSFGPFFRVDSFKLGNYIIWIFSVINILCLCFCVWFFFWFMLFKFMLWLHAELPFCRAIREMNINKFMWDLMGWGRVAATIL